MEYKQMNLNEFSVCQFFKDGTHEYVRQGVTAEEAVKAFGHYTHNVATKIGLVVRVIITDGSDYCNMEWQRGKGITFPPNVQEQLDAKTEEAMKRVITDYHTNDDGE